MKSKLFLCFLVIFFAGIVSSYAAKVFFEAEDMTVVETEKWRVVEHFPGWYYGFPSKGKMLAGASGGQAQAKKIVKIDENGNYKVWVRYLDILPYRGPFKLSIFQKGVVKGEKVFDNESLRKTDEGRKKWGDGFGQFVWDSFEVNLEKGDVEIVLTKAEPIGVSWVTRHIDLIVLCNESNYQPVMADFIEPLYLKVRMGENHKYPCVIHVFGRRPQPPWWIPHSNIYKTGIVPGCYTGYKPQGPNENFLVAGTESPWINITSFFDVMGDHKLELTAMQEYFTGVESSEFTVFLSNTPSDEGIFKKFTRSGKGSGMLLLIDLSKRDRIISDLEGSKDAFEVAKKLPDVSGKRPEKFPVMTGCAISSSFYQPQTVDNEIFVLSKLGFNGIGGYDEQYYKAGFTKYVGGATYFHLARNGCLADPNIEAINSIMKSSAEDFLKRGLFKDDMVAWSQMDEPGSVSMEHIVKCPVCLMVFREYLRKSGVKPQDFGVNDFSEIYPSDKPEDGKRYYYTALYRNQVLADFFKIGTDILKQYTPDPRTTANFGEYLTYTGNMLHSGDDWFLIFDTGGLTFGWTEDWLNHSTTYQLCGYRTDFLRAASKNRFGMYCIFRNPWDTQAKVSSEIGHGAKAIYYYNYGPYYAGIDASSHNYNLYPAVSKINHAIGDIENFLIDASVPKSPVAIFYSHSTDIWTLKQGSSIYGKERMGLWLILRHLGYPVEIITEKDIINKKINNYRIIFITGSHVPAEVTQNLSEWVLNGGVLVAVAGTGIYDRFNSPLPDTFFSIKREQFNFVSEPGRDYFELPASKTIDFVKLVDSTAQETIEVICGYQKMKNVSPSETVANFSDGSPAIVTKNYGKGKIVFCGFFPGLSYMKSAVIANRNKIQDSSFSDCPPEYPEIIRKIFSNFISYSNIKPPVITNNYLVEANLLEGSKALIITLSNWSGKSIENLDITINQRLKGKPLSSQNQIKSFESKANQTIIKMSMPGAFDFIVIPK